MPAPDNPGELWTPLVFYCSVCGSELQEEERVQKCIYCGTEEECEWLCPHGHYVCEECRVASAEEIIERTALSTTESDPASIATLLMRHPMFREHGPAHHLLVAPVILAALRNQGYPIRKGALRAALKRMKDIPHAACATRGDCGAAVGVGCAVSLLTGAKFRSDRERALTLQATAEAVRRLAEHGGARCCRQSVYSALESAAAFLERELGLILGISTPVFCPFSSTTEDCKKDACVYFGGR